MIYEFIKIGFILYIACNNVDALRRPSEDLHKASLFKSPSKSIQIVHYLFKTGNKYEISHIGVKNLQINYSPNGKIWLGKSILNTNDYNITGWSTLEIETNENVTDDEQAYAAGLLEGHLTKDLIDLHLLNVVGDFCSNTSDKLCNDLFDFLHKNSKWMNKQIYEHLQDPYWHQVKLILLQLLGLYNGYIGNFVGQFGIDQIPEMIFDNVKPFMKLLFLQLNGDMGEILAALTNTVDPFMAGSCSALIKLLDNNADLYVSHDTWTEYESMLRILKFYKFRYHFNEEDRIIVPGFIISFSSYPGILLSIDDFYLTNSNLAVIETTIGNSNVDLWRFVTHETNLCWIRVLVSNRLAYSGYDWAKLFSLYNSGTYNNQWMIVDYKKFEPFQPIKDGLLVVLEQIPGNIVWKDQSDVLRTEKYWSSYNIPYYPFIYNTSGYFENYIKYGDFFSYDKCSRAQIFKRDHSKVIDLESMMFLMRYNNYTQDEYSRCDCNPPYSAENSIAARSDLNPPNGQYPFDALGHRDHGATDMKLTSYSMCKNLEFIGISGPTYGYPNVPSFVWSQVDFGNITNHYGQPDKWEFKPFNVNWLL